MMVSSRIFGITVNGVKTDGFVPYADMLNHKRPRQTTWYYSDERKGFIIEACDDIPRGEQVYDSYGKKCNSRFFLNYGFINLNNDANEVPLIVHLNKEDPGYEIKMKLINENQKNFLKFRVVDNLEDRVMAEFLSWLRYSEYEGDLAVLYLAKNEAINEYQRKRNSNKTRDSDDSDDVDLQDVFKGTSLNAINLENETRVWLRIARLATDAIKGYETTL
jgi:protein-histidine N-methyltransferase